jgi:ABC-type dipeptide/oligopeptide/nickel transport system ATPase component
LAMQKKNHTACLFISHDLGVIREVSHRTIVMRHGSIVETGETEALFEHTDNTYTQHLLAAAQRHDDSIVWSESGIDPNPTPIRERHQQP